MKPIINNNQKSLNLSLNLTLDKFKELFKEKENRSETKLKFLIKNAYYDVKFENNSVLVKMNIILESFIDKYQILNLIPENAILKSKTIAKDIHFGILENKYFLLLNKKGLFELEFSIYIPFDSEKRKNSFTFFAPASGKLNFPELKIEKNISYGEQNISWLNPSRDRAVPYPTTGEEPYPTIGEVPNTSKNVTIIKEDATIYSEITTQISVNETMLQCQSNISYKIYKSGVDTFEFTITNAKIVNIEGNLIKNYDITTEKELNKVIIYTKEPLYSEFSFVISYEKNLDLGDNLKNTDLCIPQIKLNKINREVGKISLSSSTNIELSILELEKLNKIDILDLPVELKSDIALGSLFAFQYFSAPYKLKIGVTKHNELPIVVAMADYVVINSLLLKDGKILNQIDLKVRSNSLNFVKFFTQDNAIPLSVIVNNKATKLVKGEDNSIMIPIEKSNNGEKTFNIKLLFNLEIEKIKSSGYLEIKIGSLDIPIKKLYWNLYLPEDYKYKKFRGNLEKVESYFDDLPYEYKNLIENTSSMTMEIPKQGDLYLFEDYFINNEKIILGLNYSKKFKLFKKNNIEQL